MRRSIARRAGAAFLLLLWGQVATVNALPSSISCLLEQASSPHHHDHHDADHAVGHHVAGAKISAPEDCGAPQLLVADFVPADFPEHPSEEVAVVMVSDLLPAVLVSAVREFVTPPPRA